ncbi:hypothetical protein [Parasitella parasitica]|uniref:Uncharacterized protein n=1 Tax=Parasitella parasitica TaxID=35722 RepID=A0A0B7NIX0_9FUNG|nr:hypothetical protein [Parasitella parasitica]
MHSKEARKVIAVDLDQTLAHTLESLVEWHNDTYGTDFSVADFTTYEYWEIWGGTREESCMKIRDFYDSIHFDRIQPIQDFALEALKMLKRRHFTLVIITSRQQFVAEKTKRFVDKHYPDLSDSEQLEYVSKPKSVICQEIGVDVLIDDSLEHAFDCSALGIDVLLYDRQGQYLWNHDDVLRKKHAQHSAPTLTSTSKRLYHQTPRELSKNMHRMTSWKEIIAQFPKPSSPLRFCYIANDSQQDEEDDEDEDEEEEEEPEHYFDNPHYYRFETIEVEEMSEEEDYPLYRDSRVWV